MNFEISYIDELTNRQITMEADEIKWINGSNGIQYLWFRTDNDAWTVRKTSLKALTGYSEFREPRTVVFNE